MLLQVSTPLNGKDVQLEAVLHSESSGARPLAINVSVQAITYNGALVANIQNEAKEATLLPDAGSGPPAGGAHLEPTDLTVLSPADLSVPITIPFSSYWRHMPQFDSLRVSLVVTDQLSLGGMYLAEDNVVLQDPPISITVSGRLEPSVSPLIRRVVSGAPGRNRLGCFFL